MKTVYRIVAVLILALCCAGCRSAAGSIAIQPHTSAPTETQPLPQTLEEPPLGSISGGQTILYTEGKRYSFHYGPSTEITQLLEGLTYDPQAVCDCLPKYQVITATATSYYIDLTEGFARCDKGQAALTPQQVQQLESILNWVLTEQPGNPESGK